MPVDPKRQAAALEALRMAPPPKPQTFWDRYGGRLIVTGAVLIALFIGVRVVGVFLRSSADETGRAANDLSRGLRR